MQPAYIDEARAKHLWFDMSLTLAQICFKLHTSHVTLRRFAVDMKWPTRSDLRKGLYVLPADDAKRVHDLCIEDPYLSNTSVANRLSLSIACVKNYREANGLRQKGCKKRKNADLEDRIMDMIAHDVPSEKIVEELGCSLEKVFQVDEKYAYAEAA